jgi:hypothetical protein
MMLLIHVLREFSPFVAGLICGGLRLRDRSQPGALIIKASPAAIGILFACAAGEFASTASIAIISVALDSGAAALGLIVADVLVKRIAVRRSHPREP